MSEYIGSGLYLAFKNATTTTLSSDYRTFDTDETSDAVDATAGSDTRKVWLASVMDGSASCQLVDQTGGTTLWEALAPQTNGTLEWAPEGTASTKPKYTNLAIVTSRKRSTPYDGVVVLNVDFKLSGAGTIAAY